MTIETSKELRERIRKQQTGETLLAFSCGKDAVAAWLALRDSGFERVIPVFFYLVPGLSFVDEAIGYYERFFGERIIQMPHPSLHRMLNNAMFQPPSNLAVIDAAELPNHSYTDAYEAIRQDLGLPMNMRYATGVRAADSPLRRVSIVRHGPESVAGMHYHAVWDWKKADLLEAFKKSGVKLSVEYEVFGRSFDGLDYRFLAPMKQHFPADYKKVLSFFPLAELEILRYERSKG